MGALDDLMNPQNQGVLAAASALLQAGGPQRFPVSFGQALGGGFQAGTQAYQNASQFQNQQAMQALQLHQMQQQQAALDSYASSLPPDKAAMLRANPGLFAKMYEPYNLPSGSKRMIGNQVVANNPADLKWVDAGDTQIGVDPQTGQPVYALPKKLSPGESANLDWKKFEWKNISPNQRAVLANQAQGLALAGANYQYTTGQTPPGAMPVVPGAQQLPGTPPQLPGQAVPGVAAPVGPASVAPSGLPRMAPPVVSPTVPGTNVPQAPQMVPQSKAATTPMSELSSLPPAQQNKILSERLAKKPVDLSSLEEMTATTDQAIDLAKQILSSKALSLGTGMTSITGSIPGTPMYDVAKMSDTLKGQVMLSLLKSMRAASANGSSGFGQLSNAEGDTLRNSVTNLDRAQTTGQFKNALQTLINSLQGSKDRMAGGYQRLYGEEPRFKTYHANPQEQPSTINAPSGNWKIERVR